MITNLKLESIIAKKLLRQLIFPKSLDDRYINFNLYKYSAFNYLGGYYYDKHNKGIANNDNKIIKYYKMSIEANYPDAILILTLFYYNNSNYYKYTSDALKYYEICYNLGYINSSNFLGDYYKYYGDNYKAIKYYTIGIQNNNRFSLQKLLNYHNNLNGKDKIHFYKNIIKYLISLFNKDPTNIVIYKFIMNNFHDYSKKNIILFKLFHKIKYPYCFKSHNMKVMDIHKYLFKITSLRISNIYPIYYKFMILKNIPINKLFKINIILYNDIKILIWQMLF